MARFLGDALITLALSHAKRARIWFDSPEGYVAQPFSSSAFRVVPKIRFEQHRKRVVVEMFVPAGGRFEYGLLGATVLDGSPLSDTVDVEIPVTGSSGPIFSASLAGDLDVVRWGLPREYSDAVADGARESINTHGVPAVDGIRFAWAAHAHVGSSSHRFQYLAALVMRLLITPNDASLKDLVDRP